MIFPSETCLEIGCNKGLCVFICTTVKRVQTADLCGNFVEKCYQDNLIMI